MKTPRRDEAVRILNALRPRPVEIAIIGELDASVETETRRAIESAHRRGAPAIALRISSHGGQLYAGLKIAHDLRDVGIPVAARAHRLCASAAIHPFLSAARRSATPQTRFIFHACTFDITDIDLTAANGRMLRALADYAESLDLRDEADFMAKIALSPMMVEQMRAGDLNIGSWQAKAIGLIHEIVMPNGRRAS
jgi:ATP-dependent protease ClpP protease subunit